MKPEVPRLAGRGVASVWHSSEFSGTATLARVDGGCVRLHMLFVGSWFVIKGLNDDNEEI